VRRLRLGRRLHQPDDASKQAGHKDRHQQRDCDPERNARQSAQFLGHRLAHEGSIINRPHQRRGANSRRLVPLGPSADTQSPGPSSHQCRCDPETRRVMMVSKKPAKSARPKVATVSSGSPNPRDRLVVAPPHTDCQGSGNQQLSHADNMIHRRSLRVSSSSLSGDFGGNDRCG
jgi:hypothetical protein